MTGFLVQGGSPPNLSVTTAKIVDDAVTTAKIADVNVTTGKIANDAVTLAKMASGTDGNLITYDASGNPAAVATGDSGEVLTSAGAGAPPVMAALPASGSWILLSAQTASSSASISFTSVLTDTYDVYCMTFDGVTQATDAVEINLLFSTDNGSSYRTSAYSYVYKSFNAGASGDGNSESTSAAVLRLADGLDNSSSDPFSGQVFIFSPTNSAVFTNVTNHTGGSANANTMTSRVGGGTIQVAEDNDAVQVLASSGNLAAGTIRLYGIVNS